MTSEPRETKPRQSLDLLARVQRLEKIEESMARVELETRNIRLRRAIFYIIVGLAAFSSIFGVIGGVVWPPWGIFPGVLAPMAFAGLYVFPGRQILARMRKKRKKG